MPSSAKSSDTAAKTDNKPSSANSSDTVAFRLNHTCNIVGASGQPGDVINIPANIAEKLTKRGGGEVIETR